jgi:WD40 repeat protein
MTGDLVGTLRYMSPEQVLAKRVVIDHRTDVYSLGATLYELLTLRPPFPGEDRQELLRQIAFEEPVAPRRLARDVPAELETIVLKALERNPADRYATAQELADDLGRFVKDEPIRAQRPSVAQRARKWARRHRAIVTSAAVVFALGLVLLAASTVLIASAYQAEASEREKAQEAERKEADQRQTAERERDASQDRLYVSDMRLAQAAWEVGDVKRVQELLEQHRPAEGQRDLRGWEWYYLQGQCHGELPTFTEPAGQVSSVAWSPDDRYVAIREGFSGTITVWDATTGQTRCTLRRATSRQGGGLAWSPDGRFIATLKGGTVTVWNAATGGVYRALRGPAPLTWQGMTPLVWSPDSKQLVSSGADEGVQVWDVETGKLRATLPRLNSFREYAWSPDGGQLASEGGGAGGWDNLSIKLWDTATWQEKRTIPLGSPPKGFNQWGIHGLSWSPDGRRLAAAALWPRTWDVATGKEILQPSVPQDSSFGMGWTPEGHYLAWFFHKQTVWDTTAGKEVASLPKDTSSVFFSPDGRRFAISGGANRRIIKLFDAQTGRELFSLRGHTGPVGSLWWSPGGRRLASVSEPMVKLWDVTREQEYVALRGHTQAVWSVAWSPDGKKLATANIPDGIKIWQIAQRALTFSLRHKSHVVAWSLDGKQLASGGVDPSVRVWDVASGAETCAVRKFVQYSDGRQASQTGAGVAWITGGQRLASLVHPHLIISNPTTGEDILTREQRGSGLCGSLSRSQDGRWLAAKSWQDGIIRIWDTGTWQETALASGGIGVLPQALAWSPDAKQLAATDGRATIRVVSRETRQQLFALRGHADLVLTLAWSRDGRRLASCGRDGMIKLWDLATRQEVFSLPEQAGLRGAGTASVAWSPDGWCLASGGKDGTVKIWDASAGRRVPKPDPLANQAREREQTALNHRLMAKFLADANQLPEAEEAYRQALGLQQSLTVQFPDAPQYRVSVAWTQRALGDLLRRMGRHGEAEQIYRQALAIDEQLCAEESSDDYLRRLQETHNKLAKLYTELRQFGNAALHYREAVGLGSTAPDGKRRERKKMPPDPATENDAAWFLATCPDQQLRDPGQAVRLAETLIRRYGPRGPTDGNYWNTLGMAYYRVGDWKAAVAALGKSMGLRKGGNSFDWFFLAMAHQRLGAKEEARRWYDKAVQWMDKNKPQDEELRRFRAEAAGLLGVKESAPKK